MACHRGDVDGDGLNPTPSKETEIDTTTPAGPGSGTPTPQPGLRAAAAAPRHLFTRSRSDRVVVGVAGGLGELTGIDPVLLRLAFGVLAVAGGLGIVLYLGAWALSGEGDPASAAAPPRARPGTRPRPAVALGLIVLGCLLIMRDVGLWLGDTLVWPVALAAAGSAVIWARSDETDRARWTRAGSRIPGNPVDALFAGPRSPLRLVAGGLLLAGGMAAFLASNQALAAARTAALAMAVTAAGLIILLGPWVLRLARQAADERRERVRSEERAEIAAHLHDSVLHTLALIERAAVPPEIVSLARRQERDLRAWLNGRRPGLAVDLRGAVDQLASHVEALHHVAVDAVVVGDAPLDEGLQALVLAAQEAATNAARHSGAPRVSIYVEVEDAVVTAFVRDGGAGFDAGAVPGDRRGIAESISGRMRRNGGSAAVTTRPGTGTEVQLVMPRLRP